MPGSLTTRHGSEMPQIGLGTWKIQPGDCAALVRQAVACGYRHFDCACDYGNEAQVGDGLNQALAEGICTRDQLWVTSKLWNTYHRPEHVRAACQRTLDDLRLDYLDLYLIHFPLSQRFVPFAKRYPPGWIFDPDATNPRVEEDPVPLAQTWHAMEQLRADGMVREIGVCNFGTALLRDLLASASDPPSVLQVESHPYLTQTRLLRFCQEHQIVYTAFSPFGALSYVSAGRALPEESLLHLPLVKDIATAHGRTVGQVLLRWAVQRNTAVIPKTSRVERLSENLSVFDFELTDYQMQMINGLDKQRRYNDPGVFAEEAFHTFLPIYD